MPPKKSKKGAKKEAEPKNEAEAKKDEEKAAEEAPAEDDTKKEATKEDGGKKDDDTKKEIEEKDDKKKKKAGKKEAEEEEKADEDDEKKDSKDEDEKEEDKKEEAEDGDEKGDKKSKKRGRAKEENSVPAPSGREKRARKSVAEAAYKPEDFSQTDNSPHFIDGKGTTLEDLDAVKESIESYKDNAEELAIAYRFLFATRGRINAKEVKPALLRFNGYLAKHAVGVEKGDIEKAETAAEKKYSTKAYKLTVPVLKKLVDVFALDRTKVQDKDTLIEILLDFLGAPSAEPLKGSKPKAKKESKAKKDSGSIDDYEEIVEGEMPTDKQLRQWVRAYVRCFNTSKKSLKDAMEIAEEKFGVSLKEKKDKIKELLTEEM